MSVEWGLYLPYVPTHSEPYRELTRRQAKEEFESVMAARAHRIACLGELVGANGITLEGTEECVGRCLFIGELIIERHPHLHWVLDTHYKTSPSYQKHIIRGFTNVANKWYNLEPDGGSFAHAARVVTQVEGPRDRVFFVHILKLADMYA
jgi:hypothetical protein